MYQYDRYDQEFVDQRVAQFGDQVVRRMSGELTEDEFKPLRLMNGLYLQLHGYMLRVAIPYGTLSSHQMRTLSEISERYDRGYGHFTTRQNIQFNWPKLEEAPDILAELASAEMHAIQTSGNCIRNVTADPFAGVAEGEIEDPRIYCELIRQWSTLHPEFSFLPRKFKIAVTGAYPDRAAIRFHDIGLAIRRNAEGVVGFHVLIGGGQGRTPMVAKTVNEFVPRAELLGYLEAIMRVYNELGRRDNLYKARIKILIHEHGIEDIRRRVDAQWQEMRDGALRLTSEDIDRVASFFQLPAYARHSGARDALAAARCADERFDDWCRANVDSHRHPDYSIVTISLKPTGGIPGDATAHQMKQVADLADRFSFGEIRVTHEQNLVLAHVQQGALFDLWKTLDASGLSSANKGLAGDIICCPGLDYCGLANARSIPIAQEISTRFGDLQRQHEIGPLQIKISGCINACGHHHVGHIGILGVDRKGEEHYQITLGGDPADDAAVGEIVGPAFSADRVTDAIETVVIAYLDQRQTDETFLQTYRRLGKAPFKERLYGNHTQR